jgi:F-type H+-transporting ATPase subunit b
MLHALVAAAEEGATQNPLIPATYDIVWSAVCFAILLVFFWKKILPKMQTMLEERSAAIEGNIAKADEAQRQAEAALESTPLSSPKHARRPAASVRPLAKTASRSSPRLAARRWSKLHE